jgi:CrcB protein
VLVANTIASFVGGIAVSLASVVGPQWRLVIIAGLCGGLSTLSTLAVDTVAMWQRGQRVAAATNLAANVGLGVLAVLLGAHLG